MITRVVLFPFRVVFAVACVVLIIAAAPVLVLLDRHDRGAS